MHKTIKVIANTSLQLQGKVKYIVGKYPTDKYTITYGTPYTTSDGEKGIDITIKEK